MATALRNTLPVPVPGPSTSPVKRKRESADSLNHSQPPRPPPHRAASATAAELENSPRASAAAQFANLQLRSGHGGPHRDVPVPDLIFTAADQAKNSRWGKRARVSTHRALRDTSQPLGHAPAVQPLQRQSPSGVTKPADSTSCLQPQRSSSEPPETRSPSLSPLSLPIQRQSPSPTPPFLVQHPPSTSSSPTSSDSSPVPTPSPPQTQRTFSPRRRPPPVKVKPRGQNPNYLSFPTQGTPPFTPSPTALTWRPSEITGHLIDSSLSDDDGEGLDGVGFKPPPQIAWARRERRRQQVAGWRERERNDAREARAHKLCFKHAPTEAQVEHEPEPAAAEETRTVRFVESGIAPGK